MKIFLIFVFFQSVKPDISWTEIRVPFAPETQSRRRLETLQPVVSLISRQFDISLQILNNVRILILKLILS